LVASGSAGTTRTTHQTASGAAAWCGAQGCPRHVAGRSLRPAGGRPLPVRGTPRLWPRRA